MRFKGLKKESKVKRQKKEVKKPEVRAQKMPVIASTQSAKPASEQKVVSEPSKQQVSPSISRFITDWRLIVSIGLVIVIGITTVWLISEMGSSQQIQKNRQALQAQKQLLLQKNAQYPQDKDILLRLAMIEYQLKDRQSAEMYLHNVYAIDPNFAPARELDRELSL